MSVKEGFRKPRDWDVKMGGVGDTIIRLTQSDDGWQCPHCGAKDQVGMDCGLSHDDFVQMMHDSAVIEMHCYECDKKYWLKAFVVTKYSTSTEEKFEEDK